MSEIKPIKLPKKTKTAYSLECKDYNNYFKQQKVKMKNKVLRENSNCIDCRSNKSRFLKQKYNNKNNSKTK